MPDSGEIWCQGKQLGPDFVCSRPLYVVWLYSVRLTRFERASITLAVYLSFRVRGIPERMYLVYYSSIYSMISGIGRSIFECMSLIISN